DYTYLAMLENILIKGRSNRTGLPVRPKYDDGTPAYTLSLKGSILLYDLSEQHPISLFRKIPMKWSIGEIMWIYQDQSNELSILRNKYGVNWWDNWEIKKEG